MPTPTEQLLSRTIYDTDGVTTNWNFSFSSGYIDVAHVKAYTEDANGIRTNITVTPGMLIGQFQLQITPALAAGKVLTIYRDTPKDATLVDFTDESGFSEVALDTNAKQAVFVAAEIADLVNTTDVAAAISASAAALEAAATISSQTASSLANANAASASAAASAASAVTASTQAGLAAGSAGAASASAGAASVSAGAAASSVASASSAGAIAGAAAAASVLSTKATSGANTDITSLNSPALGSATATTAAAADNDTSVATTAFVQTELTSQAVKLTGAQTIAGVKTFSSQPVLPQAPVLGTAVATTSGTAIDFTGIPSWAKRITVMLNQVSLTGTAELLLQIGSGSVDATSTYLGSIANHNGSGGAAFTTGATLTYVGTASVNEVGQVELVHMGGNLWSICGLVQVTTGASGSRFAGVKTLAGTLDRIRLTSTNGTDTFDAGSVNILYE